MSGNWAGKELGAAPRTDRELSSAILIDELAADQALALDSGHERPDGQSVIAMAGPQAQARGHEKRAVDGASLVGIEQVEMSIDLIA